VRSVYAEADLPLDYNADQFSRDDWTITILFENSQNLSNESG
jgi:hypothetical protein